MGREEEEKERAPPLPSSPPSAIPPLTWPLLCSLERVGERGEGEGEGEVRGGEKRGGWNGICEQRRRRNEDWERKRREGGECEKKSERTF